MDSLELNWLQRRDKWLRLPSLLFVPESDWVPYAGGYYVQPQEGDLWLEGQHRDCSRGVIVCVTELCVSVDSTLAHEWRHHWQFHQGIPIPGTAVDESLGYDSAIKKHFSIPIEADALRFTLEVCGREAEADFRDVLEIPSRRRGYFL